MRVKAKTPQKNHFARTPSFPLDRLAKSRPKKKFAHTCANAITGVLFAKKMDNVVHIIHHPKGWKHLGGSLVYKPSSVFDGHLSSL